MRPAFQILRKDVERLWWAILLTFVLLAVFALHDPVLPPDNLAIRDLGSGDWFSLILPLAWSFLIAIVIHQDPLAGDRQFWIALPAGWKPLALAKAAFIVAFIQIPYFLATAAILISHGFSPLRYLPHLLWMQLLVLCLVFLAVAAAVVVRNFAQFMLVPVMVAAGTVFLNVGTSRGFQQDDPWDMRWPLALTILAIGAIAVIALQWTSRRTILSRTIGIAAVIGAVCVYNWLSRDASAAISAALSPASAGQGPVSVADTPREPDHSFGWRYPAFRGTATMIPITFSGLPANIVTHFEAVSLELSGPKGERFAATWPRSQEEYRKREILAELPPQYRPGVGWLGIRFLNPAVWNSLRQGPVTIHGRLLASFYRSGKRIVLPPRARTEIAGLGYCTTPAVPDPADPQRRFEPLECESAGIPLRNVQAGQILEGPRELRAMQESIFVGISSPQERWLWPLRKGVSLPDGSSRPWTVMESMPAGSAIVDYTIPNLDLNAFVVQPSVQTENRR